MKLVIMFNPWALKTCILLSYVNIFETTLFKRVTQSFILILGVKLFEMKAFCILCISSISCFENEVIKVNKSVYIAIWRQRYHKTLNSILLHMSNHALKDVYRLNYETIKNRTVCIIHAFFIINFFCHIMSLKQTHLLFWIFFRICPTIFGW